MKYYRTNCGCIEAIYKKDENYYCRIIVPCQPVDPKELEEHKLFIPLENYIKCFTILTNKEVKSAKLESL